MHTLTLYARCFFLRPRYTILGVAGIQRCRTESNGLAFIGKNKVMGVDGKSIKSNAYFPILGRIGSAKFRQSSNAQRKSDVAGRVVLLGEREQRSSAQIYHLRAHRLQESYQNCCLSEYASVWLEIQFQTSTASAPACIGMRKLMCATHE
jgi:hypothetical protein